MLATCAKPPKTGIVRRRTGCQRCRSKRRKCDETRPECVACVKRGVPCSGYQRPLTFKDLSAQTAQVSRKVEEAKWAALRLEDEARNRERHRQKRSLPGPRGRVLQQLDGEVRGRVSADIENSLVVHHNGPDTEQQPPRTLTETIPSMEPSLDFLSDPAGEGMELVHDPSIAQPASPPAENDLVGVLGRSVQYEADGTMTIHGQLSAESSTDAQDLMSTWSDTEISFEMWDHFVHLPEPSYPQFPCIMLPPDTQAADNASMDLPSEQALLRKFDEDIVPALPLKMPFKDMFNQSSGLRTAALALSASHHRLSSHTWRSREPGPPRPKPDCHYYDFAMRDLAQQLRRPNKHEAGQVFVTVMLLAYRDLLVGSHRVIQSHIQKLEVLAGQLEISSLCTAGLLRAWRMLLCDVRMQTMPTQKSVVTAPSQLPAPWDARLAIRDMFSSIFSLYHRTVIEASFDGSSAHPKAKAPRRVVQWFSSVLGRHCDVRQLNQENYHEEFLSKDAILERCAEFERRIEQWHRSLPSQDHPTPKLASKDDIISGPGFGPIIAYYFADLEIALDYAASLILRMMCSYLASRAQLGESPSGLEAWASVVLGIAAGVSLPQFQLTGPSVYFLLTMAAMVSDGTTVATAILDGLIPRFMLQSPGRVGMAELLRLQRSLQLLVWERQRGKTIRAIVSVFDEHQPWEDLYETNSVVGFGDCSTGGHFRELYQLPQL